MIEALTIIELSLMIGIIAVATWMVLLIQYRTNSKKDSLIFGLIIIFAILIIVLMVISGFITRVFDPHSLHLGWILGFTGLILLTIGTILVLWDEPKFVLYHGLTAGSAWILTLLNIIALVTLTEQNQLFFSSTLHFVHIVCGAIGLFSGFASLLLGISGQRRLAKISGVITFAGWWTAFLLGILFPII